MATRFYLPKAQIVGAGPLAVTPSDTASWTSGRIASGYYQARTGTTAGVGPSGATDLSDSMALNAKKIFASFYSQKLTANTTIGASTISAELWGHATTFTNSGLPSIVVRVITPTGTVRGTPLALTGATFFNGTTYFSDPINLATASSVSALTDDFLWIEVGTQDQNGADTQNMQFRDDGTTDVSANTQSSTTTQRPWVEFSDTFGSSLGAWPEINCTNQLMLVGAGA